LKNTSTVTVKIRSLIANGGTYRSYCAVTGCSKAHTSPWPLKGPQSWAREGIGSQMSRPAFAYCFRIGFNVPVACLVFTLHLLYVIQSWVIST